MKAYRYRIPCLYGSKPLLWIRDMLVRIIRIRGSVSLTNGYGSYYFRPWPSRRQQKTFFFSKFFLLISGPFWRYIYIIFLRWKVIKESQNSRNQGFSYYLCLMIEGSGSVDLTNGSGSRRPKNIRSPNTDPNTCYTLHWLLLNSVADPWHFGVDPDPGSGSCYFRHWPSRCQQKTKILTQFFLLFTFEGTFTSFFKDKMSQNSRNQGFSYLFLHDDRRLRIRTSNKRIRIQEAQNTYGSSRSGSPTLIQTKVTLCVWLLLKSADLCLALRDGPALGEEVGHVL